MKGKIGENIGVLQQGERLLQGMDDLMYRRCSEAVFGSSIGEHVRHNLDHYACFFSGLETGEINYDSRQRESVVETDRNSAMTRIGEVCNHLEGLAGYRGILRLRVSNSTSQGYSQANTSVARELEFLQSHTIHHYAIVAVMCRLEGMAVSEGLGVAPSTLRYREESKSECAR